MIFIKLEGHDFKYEIEDIVRLFCKDEEIIYYTDNPPEQSRGIFILSRLTEINKNYELYLEFKAEGIDCKGNLPVINPTGEENIKSLKKHLKFQLYEIFSKFINKDTPWGVLTGIRPTKIVHELIEEGKEKEEIFRTMKNSYGVSNHKVQLLFNVAKTEERILRKAGKDKISLYIGIPFCTTRCLYCSFTSNPINKYSHVADKYIECLETEMDNVNEIIRQCGLNIQSIYIGGGTPTSIKAYQLENLLRSIESIFDLSTLEEFTLEAGRPDTIDEEKLRAVKKSRVDRISINPQTMNDETLRLIGRNHSSEDIRKAFILARQVGFNNINMDVIVGLPGEDIKMFEKTMEEIKILQPESLTVHTLAIKKASELNKDVDNLRLISDSEASRMLESAMKYAELMNMHPYYLYRQKNILGNLENVGYCKPGFECIYNVQIMEEKQTIIAVGAGAVTKVVYPEEKRIERAFNVKGVEEYIKRVDEMVQRKRALLDFVKNNLDNVQAVCQNYIDNNLLRN